MLFQSGKPQPNRFIFQMSKFEIQKTIQKKLAFHVLFFLGLNVFGQKIKQVQVLSMDNGTKKENRTLVDFKKPFVLPYHQNNLKIIFDNTDSLITQLSPLEPLGFINDSRSVYYNNLEGGMYVFYLKDPHNQRVLDAVAFEIEPPFYKNWWFVLLLFFYVIFVAGIVIYIFLSYRFRQQTKLLKVRNNIASDLHDEVGATLSSIGISTRLVQNKLGNDSPAIFNILAQIKTDADESVQHIRDTVWSINPDNDSLETLVEKIYAFARQVLPPKDIALTFKHDLKPEKTHKLGMEQRRNVYMIVKEAINNIAKHSEASKAWITIETTANGILWTIADDGVGFDTTQIRDDNGLKNFKKRAEESQLGLKISSEQGKGTILTLSFRPV
jgi:Histidine kinase